MDYPIKVEKENTQTHRHPWNKGKWYECISTQSGFNAGYLYLCTLNGSALYLVDMIGRSHHCRDLNTSCFIQR